MDVLYDTIANFIKGIDVDFNTLLLGGLGLLLFVFIAAFIRTLFTYEVKLLRIINRLNRYFLREPYVNEENLIRFNKKMKRVPKTLRYTWQEFMLNRDKAPSEYMNTTTCVEQPSKASAYSNTATSIGTYTVILAVVAFILSVVAYLGDGVTSLGIADYFFDFFLIPVLILVLGYLFVLFMRARYTSINADLYYAFHEFERNINKACTTLPQFIDYEVLFTKREIRDGIPVLQEYLEKRALQEKIEQEEAQLNAQDFEQFDFAEIGVENSLLLDRALLESEKYFRVKTDLSAKMKAKETEMQNYQKGFDEVTKDYERKAQVLRETLQQLTDQINNTTIKIEANYMKKRYNEEQQRLQQLEKEYELSTTRFQKQQAELEEEIKSYKEEMERRKQMMQEAMMAEGRTYAKKVYSVITADVQEQSRPYLEQMERTKTELEQAVNTLKHELQFKNNELSSTNAKLEKAISEYQIRLVGLENIKELKEYLTSADYRERLLKSTGTDDGEGKKILPVKLTEKVDKLTKEVAEKEEQLKLISAQKEALEKRVKDLTAENANLLKQAEKLGVQLTEQNQNLEKLKEQKEVPVKKEKPSLFGKKKGKEEPEIPALETVMEPKPEEVSTGEPKVQPVPETAKAEPANLDLFKEEKTSAAKPEKEMKPEESAVVKPALKPADKAEEKPQEKSDKKVSEELVKAPKAEEKQPALKEDLKDSEAKAEKPALKPVKIQPAQPTTQEVENEAKTAKPNKEISTQKVKEGEPSKPVKVEKVLAKRSPLGQQEILELNAIKKRIEAESKNLQKQKSDYQNSIVQTLETIDTTKPNAPTKNKIGSSLNSLLEQAKKVENKKNKE